MWASEALLQGSTQVGAVLLVSDSVPCRIAYPSGRWQVLSDTESPGRLAAGALLASSVTAAWETRGEVGQLQ